MRFPRQRALNFRPITLYVMLLALALRALVPSGFMPDASALRDGRLEMAFCSGSGVQTVVIDTHHHDQGAPASGDMPHQQSQSNDCPFSVLSALPAMPAMDPAPVGLPLLLSPILAAPYVAPAFAAILQGPPLGSRAPPFHLA